MSPTTEEAFKYEMEYQNQPQGKHQLKAPVQGTRARTGTRASTRASTRTRTGNPMQAIFTVVLDIDTSVIERDGKRHGLTLDRALQGVIADCEHRLFDSVRFRDGVERVETHVRTWALSTLGVGRQQTRTQAEPP